MSILKIECAVKTLSTKRTPGTDGFTWCTISHIEGKKKIQFYTNFQKIEEMEIFPIHSMRPVSPWYKKQRHFKERKQQTNILHEQGSKKIFFTKFSKPNPEINS